MRGGAREGAGAKPTFDVASVVKVSIRLSEDAAVELVAFCEEKGWSLAPFVREAALDAAGLASLGSGFSALNGTWANPEHPTPVAKILPISITPAQKTALLAHVKGRPLSTFMRDAALDRATTRGRA